MRNLISLSTFVLAAAAASMLAPERAAAQSDRGTGFFIGAGVGASRVGEGETDVSAVGALLHLRAGYAIRPTAAVLLEMTQTGIGSSPPRDSIAIEGSVLRGDHQLSTTVLLLSAQLGAPGKVYVRPGLGVARHAFTFFAPTGDGGYVPGTSHEVGPAAGIAVGHELPLSGFPLAVEATALWSKGEDSSSPRVSLGLQFVHDFRF
ncbi:MAG TPA: hypothetical protein VFJ16_20525 [Longimicrobium sp.]|nr:hypothetical protein [Longimicrobium sp.]